MNLASSRPGRRAEATRRRNAKSPCRDRLQAEARSGAAVASLDNERWSPYLVDATIVRMVLVAAMQLLGRANWWIPRWLDRALPRLDGDVAHAQVAAERA
jgi:hypothetical protein